MGKIDAVTPRGGKGRSQCLFPVFWSSVVEGLGVSHPPPIFLASAPAAAKPHLCILIALKVPCFDKASPFFTCIIPLSPEFAAWSTRGMVDVYPGWFLMSLKPRLHDPVLYKTRFWGEKARYRVCWLIPSVTSWGNRRSTVEIWHSSVLFCPVLLLL